jgi:hypothetical protein
VDDVLRRKIEARLNWEILWERYPEGFRLPPDGMATLSVAQSTDELNYCSADLAGCERYIFRACRLLEQFGEWAMNTDENPRQALVRLTGDVRPPPLREFSAGDVLRPGMISGWSYYRTLRVHLLSREQAALGARSQR